MREDPCLIDADALLAAVLGKFETEAALSDSGLANHADDAAISLAGIFQFQCERGGLAASAGQRAEPLAASENPAGRGVLEPP